MSNYRRVYVPGGSYFFTVVTERWARILGDDLARDLLRAAFRDCFERWPRFRGGAMVMLRDHHTRYGLCRRAIATILNAGARSKNISRNPGWPWAARKNPARPRASAAIGAGSGNRASWNTPCATNGITPAISIISTITRSNTRWPNAPATGLLAAARILQAFKMLQKRFLFASFHSLNRPSKNARLEPCQTIPRQAKSTLCFMRLPWESVALNQKLPNVAGGANAPPGVGGLRRPRPEWRHFSLAPATLFHSIAPIGGGFN